MKRFLLISILFLFSEWAFGTHTLTDGEVTVTNGKITYCGYTGSDKDIIIPNVLDGQTVKVIGYRVFYSDGLTSVKLPTTIEIIEEWAFRYNSITNIDFSGCSSLRYIGRYAFFDNALTSLDLSDCTSLVAILDAFYGYRNTISGFNLPTHSTYSGLGWMENSETQYSGGDFVSNFRSDYRIPFEYTLTDADVVVSGGVITSCSYIFESIRITMPETLDGQTVTGIADAPDGNSGIFAKKGILSITFPTTLKTIGDFAFYYGGLKNNNLSLCKNLTSIGREAFRVTSITNADFSDCTALETIERGAFMDTNLETLSLAGCSSLKSIGQDAFECGLVSVDLTGCSSLESIGYRCFNYNEITSLDLSDCSALLDIGAEAFKGNNLNTIDLSACTSLFKIGEEAFEANNFSSFALPVNTLYNSYGWVDGNFNKYAGGASVSNLYTNYRIPIPYTLTDDDVEVTSGILTSCPVSFQYSDIIIPTMLDGQTVTGIANKTYNSGIFYTKNLTSVELPASIEEIGDFAFANNDIHVVDLSNCTSLTRIGSYTFRDNPVDSLTLPVHSTYSSYGWRDSDNNLYSAGETIFANFDNSFEIPAPHTLTDDEVEVVNGFIISCSYDFSFKDIIIPEILDLQTVIGIAHAPNYSSGIFADKSLKSVVLPTSIEVLGDFCFDNNSLYSVNFHECTSLDSIGESAFDNNTLNSLDFSAASNLKYIGKSAFSYCNLYSINLSGCTSLKKIDDYAFQYLYYLDELDLSGCTSLDTIGEYAFYSAGIDSLKLNGLSNLKLIDRSAFYDNDLKKVDFSNLTSLTTIGNYAFGYNDYLSEIIFTNCTALECISDDAFYESIAINTDLSDCISLNYIGSYAFEDDFTVPSPEKTGYLFQHWLSSGNSTYEGGTLITQTWYSYTAVFEETYTATFNVNDGVNPVEDVTINLDGYAAQTTDTAGKAIFTVTNNDSVAYTAVAKNYFPITDSISIQDANVTENVTMISCMDSISLAETICEGEVFNVGDSAYTETGTFVTNLTNQFGCDSIVTLNLTVKPVHSTELAETICEGDIVNIGDSAYAETGTFVTNLTNQFGCDSIVTLNLTVLPTFTALNATICEGDSYPVGDSTYFGTGIYTDTLTNQLGCDSIVTLNLTVTSVFENTIEDTICEGEVYSWQNNDYSVTGTYTDTFTTKYGCDSIVTLNLAVNPVHSFEQTETICEGDQVDIGDSTYTITGIFITPMKNQYGCDSIVTLDLTVLPLQTIIDNEICEGETIIFGNSTYSSTGIYKDTLTNQLGCDSIIILNLTVNPGDAVTLNKTICEGEAYSMGGEPYSVTGEYTTTLTNHNGCDSIVTLNLTVNPLDAITLIEAICEGETYSMGGEPYSVTGEYTTTLTNRNGCDSVVTLKLTVNSIDTVVIYDTIYQGESYLFNRIDYTEAGSYEANLVNQSGCDSIIHLQLFVKQNLPPVIQNAVMDINMKVGDSIMAILDLANNVFYDENDTALSYAYTVSPEQHNWIDDTLSEGLLVFNLVPSIQDTGCYAVVIQATDPWSQTVNDTFNICVIPNYDGINEWAAPKPVFKIYPNPSADRVTIEFQAPLSNRIEICIYNNAGENIFRKSYDEYSKSIVLNVTEYVSGIYLVTVSSEKQRFSRKLIINKNR